MIQPLGQKKFDRCKRFVAVALPGWHIRDAVTRGGGEHYIATCQATSPDGVNQTLLVNYKSGEVHRVGDTAICDQSHPWATAKELVR